MRCPYKPLSEGHLGQSSLSADAIGLFTSFLWSLFANEKVKAYLGDATAAAMTGGAGGEGLLF